MNERQLYQNPLVSRYASPDMSAIFGDQKRFTTWRQLWIALATAQRELGLNVSEQQIQQMQEHVANIDFEKAAIFEKNLRHDVMAHVHTFGAIAPEAMPIIHLGATSCFITDNTDLLLIRDALRLTTIKLAAAIQRLTNVAKEHRDLPCLGFTHFQPAQPTTIGKRITLWIYDLMMDLEELEHRQKLLRCRSIKGTTGTQASFLNLFEGDHSKVKQLEHRVAELMGFERAYEVSGQTYSRKVDSQLLDSLSGIAQSVHKLASDIRLMANRKEMEEPFERNQIGSSAMAYKRNPMRCERMCSLARYVMALPQTSAQTVATQWLERTLDDSAVRRITIPQAFLGIDSILTLLANVADGLVVYPRVVEKNLFAELPFMATENIMMEAVKAGGNRQDLHERIRELSVAAGVRIKQEGLENNLLENIKADPLFADVDIDALIQPQAFVGRAPEQVDEFLNDYVAPRLQPYSEEITELRQAEINV